MTAAEVSENQEKTTRAVLDLPASVQIRYWKARAFAERWSRSERERLDFMKEIDDLAKPVDGYLFSISLWHEDGKILTSVDAATPILPAEPATDAS